MPNLTTSRIQLDDVSLHYGRQTILDRISLGIASGRLTAITGPSGSGKSSLLTLFNGLWHEENTARVSGTATIALNGHSDNLLAPSAGFEALRRQVGLVFQTPNPLPMSIFRNVAFPLKLAGIHDRSEVAQRVEQALKRVHLWDEVAERLQQDGRQLSGGQQQRLCIARSLVLQPTVLLLDEPTSSLDEAASRRIEQLLAELKTECTLVLVSHDSLQVERLADCRYHLEHGRLVV